ncbi:formate dehydrogenase accessory sulfurtransferase FdhD [Thalassotalea euphylliae]|uniref:Sulfur carrier protein FdhD n=1 Tax=Thalassotalea euphylliae TaxID=1655234 RepID=A0A3E0TW43_9GAMM|nr:formate dehydrogenase accessory sulfurtransferase FdhD [Thalassotalea euphylliae]REL28587.1 formate dehydrogenase accessory sulfurtransferase FdhD [Thalassotalea euphylliae]
MKSASQATKAIQADKASQISKTQLVICNEQQTTRLVCDKASSAVSVKVLGDMVASEQALQIMLSFFDQGNWQQRSLAVVMRTPGDDKALVLGYLISQGVINALTDVQTLSLSEENLVEVKLAAHVVVDWQRFSRVFASQSGCGVCGQSQLKQLALRYEPQKAPSQWLMPAQLLTLPALLRDSQDLFAQTGGSHGAGLWLADEQNNKLAFTAEDVGRHNAVDKVLGGAYQQQVGLRKSVLVLSGRISFELVQKAVAAKIPAIVAVGAPSDLAIATAQQFNIALIGFTRAKQANVYCGQGQLRIEHPSLIERPLSADK